MGATTPLGSTVDQRFIDTHNRFRLNKDSIKQSMAEGGKIFANMCDDWINVHRLTKLESMQYFTLI